MPVLVCRFYLEFVDFWLILFVVPRSNTEHSARMFFERSFLDPAPRLVAFCGCVLDRCCLFVYLIIPGGRGGVCVLGCYRVGLVVILRGIVIVNLDIMLIVL